MNRESNGFHTTHTSGEEGREETQGQGDLQLKTHPPDGGTARKKRSYIVRIENSSQHAQSFVEEVESTDELVEKIYERFPSICKSTIGLRISTTQTGSINRQYLKGLIPQDVDYLFVNLYLQRHS